MGVRGALEDLEAFFTSDRASGWTFTISRGQATAMPVKRQRRAPSFTAKYDECAAIASRKSGSGHPDDVDTPDTAVNSRGDAETPAIA